MSQRIFKSMKNYLYQKETNKKKSTKIAFNLMKPPPKENIYMGAYIFITSLSTAWQTQNYFCTTVCP